ncbi:Protein O-glucosyltransferase 3 [Perkinsus chesapeaki]|uniref:Protein O-glucosyltransferase 3 n=1 Tax=Perkinsus chesapeaki TaxID=330153 RepID=A0A7J6MKC2_PERCH|nr:Protein O-glucosyltransferase 3 [Perkinsus chesapeaki]
MTPAISLIILLFANPTVTAWSPGSSALSCEEGAQEWTSLRKALYRLYFTEGGAESSREVVALTEELAEYAGKRWTSSSPAATHWQNNSIGSCPLGYVTARLTLAHLTEADREEIMELVAFIDNYDTPDIVSSGWPFYRAVRELRTRFPETYGSAPNTTECHSGVAPVFESYLESAFIRRSHVGSSTIAAVSGFLLGVSVADREELACGYLISAAYLALAVDRFPTFDHQVPELIHLAFDSRTSMSSSQFLTDRSVEAELLLYMLGEAEHSYFTFLLYSNALYTPSDPSTREAEAYARHMVSDEGNDRPNSLWGAGDCLVDFATTPTGQCNPYAPIAHTLKTWRTKGITRNEVQMALKQRADQKTILVTVKDNVLYFTVPVHSHYFGQVTVHEELLCLVSHFLKLLSRTSLPDFELALNHGDLPQIRKSFNKPPFHHFNDREASLPVPLFSIATSDDFWDILFPNVCRPKLVNMSQSSSDEPAWNERIPKAIWRGTDRGAVNWFTGFDLDGLHSSRSLRQTVKQSGSKELTDIEFLEDDLTDSSVAASDPNFIPMDQASRQWKYMLDIPGNGYSGSLKQKLTSSALVLPVRLEKTEESRSLYEHFYAGLKDKEHVLLVTCDDSDCDTDEQVKLAEIHGIEAREASTTANKFMDKFNSFSFCYTWRLIQLYAEMLQYDIGNVPRNTDPNIKVHRYEPQHVPTRVEELKWQNSCLQDMYISSV